MQLYVLNPDPKTCADLLYKKSPKIARAQLKEGMQMIAANPLAKSPVKVNGEPYSDYWKRHPVTKWVLSEPDKFWWTVDFLHHLSLHEPLHGCTISLHGWLSVNGYVSWESVPQFRYFGSTLVPGRTVYEKYRNYLKMKLENTNLSTAEKE